MLLVISQEKYKIVTRSQPTSFQKELPENIAEFFTTLLQIANWKM